MKLIVADYLLDENFKLRKNWAIKVSGSKITAVGPSESLEADRWINLGRAVLMPGFINAHTHLELTSLGKMVHRTRDFTAWLDQVRELRNAQTEEYIKQSAREGIAQSLMHGSTTLVNHCNSGLSLEAMSEMPARGFILYELIAFDKAVLEKRLPLFKQRIRNTRETALMKSGLAPHAPYSVSNALFEWVRKIRTRTRCPMSIHLHEHLNEGRFLETGDGPFRDFLQRLGTGLDEYAPPGVSPAKHLENLGLLDEKSILVHCNYVSDEDIDLIKKARATVAYCPRSHNYFYHENHPLERMLERGVNVALGTDSMVSNWSLSMLDELRYVRKNYPTIKPEAVLKMAFSGARPLGLENEIGTLAEGRRADVVALGNLPDGNGLHIHDVFQDEVENIFTMVDGKEVFQKNET